MSKHKNHRRHENNSSPNVNNLSELLNNTDINQLAAALSAFANNQQRTQGVSEQMPPNPMMGGMGANPMGMNPMNMGGSPELMMLNAIRPFLNPQRAEMLDKFIQMFAQSGTMNQQEK